MRVGWQVRAEDICPRYFGYAELGVGEEGSVLTIIMDVMVSWSRDGVSGYF